MCGRGPTAGGPLGPPRTRCRQSILRLPWRRAHPCNGLVQEILVGVRHSPPDPSVTVGRGPWGKQQELAPGILGAAPGSLPRAAHASCLTPSCPGPRGPPGAACQSGVRLGCIRVVWGCSRHPPTRTCACLSQAITTEGKYWKSRIEIVIREYHKWRTYFKKRVSGLGSRKGALGTPHRGKGPGPTFRPLALWLRPLSCGRIRRCRRPGVGGACPAGSFAVRLCSCARAPGSTGPGQETPRPGWGAGEPGRLPCSGKMPGCSRSPRALGRRGCVW